MRVNQCQTCKHAQSGYEKIRPVLIQPWERFYILCSKLDNNEITPILHDFIATCGCASWEKGEE